LAPPECRSSQFAADGRQPHKMTRIPFGSRSVSNAVARGISGIAQDRQAMLVRDIALMIAYNTVVGLFIGALTEYGFTTTLVFSHCIGFCIYAAVMGSKTLSGRSKPGWANGAVGIPLGCFLGVVLAAWLLELSLAELFSRHARALLICGLGATLFGVLGTWHFHDVGSLREAQAEADAERLRRAERDAAATHAELARLQAQIEPHFLFNTLSNVVGLIDTDPATARRMLIDLTGLLRTALARTRQAEVSLGEELQLLRAYLAIMAVRMGERLQWTIEADPALLGARLPPLLVQPLVENAICHGLEPKSAGGHLAVRCRRVGDSLVVEVEDDGMGFAPTEGAGVGLANIRERLRACYGEAAALSLEEAPGGGVRARIRMPMEAACAS
jgi:signal transduction histidine kinase